MKIDLVYLWVNGNDPKWLAKKNAYSTEEKIEIADLDCQGRYADSDELKFSLRSVEKFANWVNKIYIVTNNQTPVWLDLSNPKVKIIDHSEILPAEIQPCFNGLAVENFMYKIPELSEYFLYSNDDMFFNKPLQPDFFFAADGLPFARLYKYKHNEFEGKWRLMWKNFRNQLDYWKFLNFNVARKVEKVTGKFYGSLPHHNIDGYRKSDFAKTMEVFAEEVKKTSFHRIREKDDFFRGCVNYYSLATKRAYLLYVKSQNSLVINVDEKDYEQKLSVYKPELFCINDHPNVSNKDRIRMRDFLENYFPKKSEFEK
ncbi:MAG: Stealth CR1 domain-containing protein [Prevotellaceae bacterium]|jgi:hypothetical protein|nr:Stealth CR1 domain-containing protein [Prevotellaceae bacterium]